MSFKNKLLIARPNLKDPVFSGKVVFIIRQNEKGVSGMILNGHSVGKVGYGCADDMEKIPQSQDEMKQLIDDGKMPSLDITLGGPCGFGKIAILHPFVQFVKNKDENEAQFSLGSLLEEESEVDPEIMEGVYFGTPEIISQVMERPEKFNIEKFRFFMGISAWSPGQLEEEIKQGAWDVMDATSELIFDKAAIAKLVPPQEPAPDTPNWQSWDQINPLSWG